MFSNLIIIIGTAFITSFFTVVFAYWRFAYEKKWENKAAAYKKIIESLYDIKQANHFFYIEFLISNEPDDKYNPKQKNDHEIQIHANKYKEAIATIERIADVEAIFLGNKAVCILKKLISDYNNINKLNSEGCEPDVIYKEEADVIELCITDLRKWAEKHLLGWWQYTITSRMP